MENSYQKFARDVFIIGIANGLVALSGIIFMPLITKTLGAYDYGMSQAFFQDLNLPEPDIYPGVCSGSHGEQTGKVMIEMEQGLRETVAAMWG